MSNFVINGDNKELFIDFFFLLQNTFKKDREQLNEFIRAFNIKNVSSFEELEPLFRNRILKKVFICMIDGKSRTINVNTPSERTFKEVILRVVFDDWAQTQFPPGTILGLTADIDTEKLVINVKSLFLTRINPIPQDFESTIIEIKSQVINYKSISDDEIMRRNVLNSATIGKLGILVSNFNVEKSKWNEYLEFSQLLLDYKSGDSIFYIASRTVKMVKCNLRALKTKTSLDKFIKIRSKTVAYFRFEDRDFLEDIDYDEVSIGIFRILDNKQNSKFKKIIKNDLCLLPLFSNKNIKPKDVGNNEIQNFINYVPTEQGDLIDGNALGDLIFGDENSDTNKPFLEYLRKSDKKYLLKIPTEKEAAKNHFYDELIFKKVYFELTDNFDKNLLDDKTYVKGLAIGYIVPSNVGESVLIKRSSTALERINSGRIKNPYLANYLFNTELITLKGDETYKIENLNFYFSLNKYQQQAVAKALNSKDIFIIQGPPGTGKTQVISEIVFQLAQQNRKVLLSSQNHEAINNVVTRLPLDPDLVRIKPENVQYQNSKKINNFAPERTVKNYYEAIDRYISDSLKNNDHLIANSEKEIQILDLFLGEYNANKNIINILNDLNQDLANVNNEISQKLAEIQEIKNINADLAERKLNLQNIISDAEKGEFKSLLILDEDLNDQLKTLDLNNFKKIYSNNIPLTFDSNNILENFRKFYEIVIKENTLFIQKKALQIKIADPLLTNEKQQIKIALEFLKEKMSNNEIFASYNKASSQIFIKATNFFNNLPVDVIEQTTQLNSELELLKVNRNQILVKKNELESKFNTIQASLQIQLENFNIQYKKNFAILDKDLELAIRAILDDLKNLSNDFSKKLINLRPLYKTILEFLSKTYQNDFLTEKEVFSKNFSNQLKLDSRRYLSFFLTNMINIFSLTLTSRTKFKMPEFIIKEFGLEELDLNALDVDTVIIDEASKATLVEILMPLIFGKNLILVGDYRQLPPVFKIRPTDVELVNEKWNQNYDFFRFKELLDQSVFKQLIISASENVKQLLKIQYRSSFQIMEIVNHFYNNALEIGENVDENKKHFLEIKTSIGNNLIVPNNSAYWIDSTNNVDGEISFEISELNSTSLYNQTEIDITMEMMKKIDKAVGLLPKKLIKKPVLAIISFYALHVKKLNEHFKRIKNNLKNVNVQIKTVDDFQGKEADYVIVNLVRNPKSLSNASREFIKRYERINVAMSRAQKLLIVVGAIRSVQNVPVEIPDINNPKIMNTSQVYDDIISRMRWWKTVLDTNLVFE